MLGYKHKSRGPQNKEGINGIKTENPFSLHVSLFNSVAKARKSVFPMKAFRI